MSVDGTQIKVLMPTHLYDALKGEADQAGVTMADLVRLAVVDRYRRQTLHDVVRARQAGVITVQEAAERLAIMDDQRVGGGN